MKGFRCFFKAVLFTSLSIVPGLASDLIAHYRFDTDGSDCLGQAPPFLLTNGQRKGGVPPVFVLTNAPFTNGVLFVNGLYEPNGHFVHYLGTDPIPGLRYDSFSFSLDFYPLPRMRSAFNLSKLENRINSLTQGGYLRWRGVNPNPAICKQDNIITGGYYYRWFGVNRESGVLNLTLNNGSFAHPFKGVTVKPGRWHNVACSVDLRGRQIFTTFDGKVLEPIQLPSDFKLEVVGSQQEERDKEFTLTDYSKGSVFYGYLANFKIFGHGLSASELGALYPGEYPSWPKPSSPWMQTLLIAAVILLGLIFVLRQRCWREKRVISRPCYDISRGPPDQR